MPETNPKQCRGFRPVQPWFIESVLPLTGQSPAWVVLYEVEFQALSRSQRTRLFVGMTGADLAVLVALSSRFATGSVESGVQQTGIRGGGHAKRPG